MAEASSDSLTPPFFEPTIAWYRTGRSTLCLDCELLADYGIKPDDGPVRVADRCRAIADIEMHRLQRDCLAEALPACQFAGWPWSGECLDILVKDDLELTLRSRCHNE